METIEDFKEVLAEYERMQKEGQQLNDHDKAYYLAMNNYKKLILSSVSISFIDQIKKQIEYHQEQETTRASVKDYGQATYHNNRRGALEDLLVWIKLNEC